MNKETLELAIAEAQRFLIAAREVKTLPSGWVDSPSKQAGSAKRASMDLTRALAKMRAPN